jgi:hypothetical protein
MLELQDCRIAASQQGKYRKGVAGRPANPAIPQSLHPAIQVLLHPAIQVLP